MRIITGSARGVSLFTLPGEATRPTAERTKEAVFSMIQFDSEGRSVLDLFAGSGQLALEALSRGAASAVLCDRSKDAINIIKRNAEKTRLSDRCKIFSSDAQTLLGRLGEERFDIVFLDPPYAMHDMTPVMDALRPLLQEDAVILLEHEAKTFPSTPDGFELYDSRKYGIAGVSFFRQWKTEEAE